MPTFSHLSACARLSSWIPAARPCRWVVSLPDSERQRNVVFSLAYFRNSRRSTFLKSVLAVPMATPRLPSGAYLAASTTTLASAAFLT